MTTGFDLDEIERLSISKDVVLIDNSELSAMLTKIRELRATVATLGDSARAGANVLDAKDAEIRELRAENARLKEAVVDLADNIDDWDGVSGITEAVIDTARAALGEPQ